MDLSKGNFGYRAAINGVFEQAEGRGTWVIARVTMSVLVLVAVLGAALYQGLVGKQAHVWARANRLKQEEDEVDDGEEEGQQQQEEEKEKHSGVDEEEDTASPRAQDGLLSGPGLSPRSLTAAL